MQSIFIPIIIANRLRERGGIPVQSPKYHLFRGGSGLIFQKTDMREATFALDQAIESMLAVARHYHTAS
ncbi:MAG: hypothetical protein ABI856_10090 [Nitrospira sp.]